MIIIIEGPDGAGKTTLANQLSRQTKYDIVHRSQPKTDDEKKHMMSEYVAVIKSSKNIILDRCWYSEMVYGPIMRDASVISYPEMYELEKLLAKAGAIVIYATAPKAALWQRCQKRGEDYITSHTTFCQICDAYEQLMTTVPHYIPVLKYEYKEV